MCNAAFVFKKHSESYTTIKVGTIRIQLNVENIYES